MGVFTGVNEAVDEETVVVHVVSDCAGIWQTCDTIDRLLAQANKALLLNMDPTLNH